MKTLKLVDVIQRSLRNKDDVRPLVKYLRMDEAALNFGPDGERAAATAIADHLRKMGSNDIATLLRRGEGVEYEEIVLDVGEKLKAKVKKDNTVEENEKIILLKLFEDALDRMSDDEKRAIFRSMGISEQDIPLGPIGVAIVQNLLREFGGFYIYQVTVVVANMVSRALLGSGLSFATNALITRTLSAMLGPIGWIATGLWLAVDLAGPAYRKTVPSVVHVALLRTMLLNQITIGIVGDGSAGKDSLISAVFGLPSNPDPVAGSTQTAISYKLNRTGTASVVNYPGFNDYREATDKYTDELLHHTDVFVMVVDINRGISGTDTKILDKLKQFEKPILICLNKVDLTRNDAHLWKLEQAASSRLPGYRLIKTAFDPDPRLDVMPLGLKEVYEWIREQIQQAGKDLEGDNFPAPTWSDRCKKP